MIDTNVCIDLMNSPTVAGARIGNSPKVVVPLIVVGELFHGAYNSKRVADNLRRIDEFAKMIRVVGIDWLTAAKFGEVRTKLLAKGKPIPDDDMWIAAITLQQQLPLVTRDKHFDQVDGLEVIPW